MSDGHGGTVSIARYAYENAHGPIAKGLVIVSTCGEPRCLNHMETISCSERVRRSVRTTSMDERFWAKVVVAGEDECWLWSASVTGGGYGQLGRPGKGSGNAMAHRHSYEIANGPIPDGLYVLHSCDTPRCVNPAHLRTGTQKENIADMDKRHRGNRPTLRGERAGLAKLTWIKVAEIRQKYAEGSKQTELAALYGVGQSTISAIIRRLTWR